jgi:RimJ/RimL family protein N-acetyltransferase
MTCETCAFETDRLLVREWHSITRDHWQEQDLADLVVSLMTEPVTRPLPSPWRGEYTVDRAVRWIAERDSEGPTLLVVERSTGQAVGLVILFEAAAGDDTGGIDVRLGYLLAESAWGKGLASELIEGFVGWSRAEAAIRSLAGGVERDNVASTRVLEKNGFHPAEDEHSDSEGDRLFELRPRG